MTRSGHVSVEPGRMNGNQVSKSHLLGYCSFLILLETSDIVTQSHYKVLNGNGRRTLIPLKLLTF